MKPNAYLLFKIYHIFFWWKMHIAHSTDEKKMLFYSDVFGIKQKVKKFFDAITVIILQRLRAPYVLYTASRWNIAAIV